MTLNHLMAVTLRHFTQRGRFFYPTMLN